MSSDPAFRFLKFLFLPNSVLTFRKIAKFEGNWLKNEKGTGKKQIGGWKTPPPPVLIGLSFPKKSSASVISLSES